MFILSLVSECTERYYLSVFLCFGWLIIWLINNSIALTKYIPKILHGWFDTVEQLAYGQTWLSVCGLDKLKGGEYYNSYIENSNLNDYVTDPKYYKKLWTLMEQLIVDTTGSEIEIKAVSPSSSQHINNVSIATEWIWVLFVLTQISMGILL